MTRTRITFVLEGSQDTVNPIVRRMLDGAGFVDVKFSSAAPVMDEITVRTSDGCMRVPAHVHGAWAANPTVLQDDSLSLHLWSVTHVSSGTCLRIGARIDEKLACVIAAKLNERVGAVDIHDQWVSKPTGKLITEVVRGLLWPAETL